MMENNQIGLKCLLECRNQILVFYQKFNIYLVIIFHHVFGSDHPFYYYLFCLY